MSQGEGGGGSSAVDEFLGPLEALCLRVLWRFGEATVAAVRGEVNGSQAEPLAYTTVVTVLSRLHDKGFVDRQRAGRGFVYRPAHTE